MQISADQSDEATLSAFGVEAVQLLGAGDMSGLTLRFGYALAYGRALDVAVHEDLERCLGELHASRLVPAATPGRAKVTYVVADNSGLFAVVEVPVPTDNGAAVLVELVVSGSGQSKHITLEQLSAAA